MEESRGDTAFINRTAAHKSLMNDQNDQNDQIDQKVQSDHNPVALAGESTVDSLVHQACDERARLLRAMQCSGAMFDTNMQCVAYILSLKKENSLQKQRFESENEVSP